MRIDFSTDTTRVIVDQVAVPSLGNHSYVVTVGDQAVVIDPQRDVEQFEMLMDRAGSRLVAVLETHVHNDYVSGGFWLARRHGAPYILPSECGATFPHTELADGEAFGVGSWSLVARDTPGHTFHHTSYVLVGPTGDVAVFTGGSMLVGAVGRSDLLGPESTDELLSLQYHSVTGLISGLDAPTVVAPTHGAGSFCSASPVAGTTSTIEAERRHNPVCLAPSEEAFISTQKAGYGLFPDYYAQMAPANLEPRPLPDGRDVPRVTLDAALASGVDIVDCRPFAEFARGHLRGSISVPPSLQDATYLAWTLPWNSPIAIVGSEAAVDTLRDHLMRIGWDTIEGRIDPSELAATGVELVATRTARFVDVMRERPKVLIDARDPADHAGGIIDGAIPAHVSALAQSTVVSDQPVWVHCQSGYRAAVSIGFLERSGCDVTAVIDDLPAQLVSLRG